jgi:hypothetical protein
VCGAEVGDGVCWVFISFSPPYAAFWKVLLPPLFSGEVFVSG